MTSCQLCRKPVHPESLYRLVFINPVGENLLDMALHSLCYAKVHEVKLTLLSDMVVPEVRKKAKQRILLTTVFESVDPKEGS